MINQLPYWLAAIYLPSINPSTFLQWVNAFSNSQALFEASTDELMAKGLNRKEAKAIQTMNWKVIEKEMQWGKINGQQLICYADQDYPPLLKEITDPPLVLYVKGDKTLLKKSQLALVGSRSATSLGLENAEAFAFALAKAGFCITSGLALGIDTASHRGALSATGETIAVLGTGLHYLYPASNKRLAAEIIEKGGAMISEFPLDTKPYPQHFPRRNRIISGLSVGVLVVEAALKSGSLITARLANEQGREVFAIPGSIHEPYVGGCHRLIREGAKLVESPADILEEFNHLTLSITNEKKPRTPSLLPDSLKKILFLIENRMTPLDVILSQSGLTAGEVSSMLLSLELKGEIKAVPGGYARISQ